MGYYRGDYYRGDYYRGDLFGTLGKVVKGAVGFATGGIGGAITALAGPKPKAAPPPPPGGIYQVPVIGSVATGIRNLVNPYTGKGRTAPAGTPGYHPKKDGSGVWVRNRHMNPTNVRALRRADRRAHSFLKIAKSVTRHYVAKQPKGRAYVKARKR